MRNRWGIEIKKGYFVQGRGPRGGEFSGVVAAVDSSSAYAKGYGPQLTLDNGSAVSADDVSQTLGKMTVSRGGVVKQNPLTRIKRSEIKSKPSQATGLPPDERLVKRRKRTANMVVPGIFANPLTRVVSRTSDSQRSHIGPNGKKTKHATRRLIKRRDYTEAAPEGFYANPAPRQMYVLHRVDANGKPVYHVAIFNKKSDAVEFATVYAKQYGVTLGIETKKL